MLHQYDPTTYGNRIADVYDQMYTNLDPEPLVSLLASLAPGGRALELGIGTGLIALPLVDRRLEVHGIDASDAMVAQVRAKPGGDRIPVTMGDFSAVPIEGAFDLVFVVFNTFFCLLSQDDQVRCFRNVAQHLTPDGVFLIEAFVPDVARYARGQQYVSTTSVERDQVAIDVSRHDPVLQQVASQHVLMTEAGIRLLPVALRYAWPGELDLMAQLAGLHLRNRWGDWHRAPFTANSVKHISVYGRPG